METRTFCVHFLWCLAALCKFNISSAAECCPSLFIQTNLTLVWGNCLPWVTVYSVSCWYVGEVEVCRCVCVKLWWSRAPVVRYPGSGGTQRDPTERMASLLSHVALVAQTASRNSHCYLTSQNLNKLLSYVHKSWVLSNSASCAAKIINCDIIVILDGLTCFTVYTHFFKQCNLLTEKKTAEKDIRNNLSNPPNKNLFFKSFFLKLPLVVNVFF